MPSDARLLLLRHGESTWNVEHRWQGWLDAPLTPTGEAQAAARARTLAHDSFAPRVIYTSDLQRAARTAEIIAAHVESPVITDAGFRERYGGEWQGHTGTEIDERWPGMRDAWRRGEVTAPPGGEEDADVLARFDAALARVLEHVGIGVACDRDAPRDARASSRHARGVDVHAVIPNLGGYWFDVVDGTLTNAEAARMNVGMTARNRRRDRRAARRADRGRVRREHRRRTRSALDATAVPDDAHGHEPRVHEQRHDPARTRATARARRPTISWGAVPARTEDGGGRGRRSRRAERQTSCTGSWSGCPPKAGSVPSQAPGVSELDNTGGTKGWTPPCPPAGSTHHYRFTVYALNDYVCADNGDASNGPGLLAAGLGPGAAPDPGHRHRQGRAGRHVSR